RYAAATFRAAARGECDRPASSQASQIDGEWHGGEQHDEPPGEPGSDAFHRARGSAPVEPEAPDPGHHAVPHVESDRHHANDVERHDADVREIADHDGVEVDMARCIAGEVAEAVGVPESPQVDDE